MIEQAKKQFIEFLAEQDLKLTSQRDIILEVAFRAKGHFTADDLLSWSKKKDSQISKATVYRTLSLLTEAKILEEHDFGQGQKHYERLLGHHHHDHLVCVRCQKILEFENEEIEKIQSQEAKKRNFKIIFHSHKLFGLCQSCQSS